MEVIWEALDEALHEVLLRYVVFALHNLFHHPWQKHLLQTSHKPFNDIDITNKSGRAASRLAVLSYPLTTHCLLHDMGVGPTCTIARFKS